MNDSRIEKTRLGEPYLLTPGPLSTSYAVKQAMLCDWGSWDSDFRAMTLKLRQMLLEMTGDKNDILDCVPMQGSGTFAVEAMLGSLLAKDTKTLVLSNGAYGLRIAKILQVLGRDHVIIDKGDYMPPRGSEVASALEGDPNITHVVVVHCETSSGILNPVKEIADVVKAHDRKILIDSMSAFGAIPLDFNEIDYEAIVSSANKCIEGVPGFGFIIAKKEVLAAAKGNAHSLSLDVHDQWQVMNNTGQWRFTPPTHVVAAFLTALQAHKTEGSVAGRGARYAENRDVLVKGMRALGFETLLDAQWLSPIIVTFFAPQDSAFKFDIFYQILKEKGFIIYPGKLTIVDSFRIGCIGQIDQHVMVELCEAVEQALKTMDVKSAAAPQIAIKEREKLNIELNNE
ncbi:MAG: 2-aminoethylphosphonate--pyruvate transaminase [Rhizobiaceae bacterium]